MIVGEYCGSNPCGINPLNHSFFPSAIAGSVFDQRYHSNLGPTKLLLERIQESYGESQDHLHQQVGHGNMCTELRISACICRLIAGFGTLCSHGRHKFPVSPVYHPRAEFPTRNATSILCSSLKPSDIIKNIWSDQSIFLLAALLSISMHSMHL